MHILLCNRPKLKKYLGFGMLDFHARYGYKSIRHDGVEVACLKDIRDPMTHDIIAQHVWVTLDKGMSKTLDHLPKDSPVRVHGKVITYDQDTKIGIKPKYINLVKGQRTYTLSSAFVGDKKHGKISETRR